MKGYIEKRALEVGKYIVDNNATVRSAARFFGVSKSTVHMDITVRLPHINKDLADRAGRILAVNKSERHIRGGLATREKYLSQKII